MLSIALALLTPLANDAPAAGELGGPGLAIRSSKIVTCANEGPAVLDNAVLLVRDGKIEAIGRARDVEVPADYEFVDVGRNWLMPGMIDLHCHAGAVESLLVNDLNDGVFLTNPGLRAIAATNTAYDRDKRAQEAPGRATAARRFGARC